MKKVFIISTLFIVIFTVGYYGFLSKNYFGNKDSNILALSTNKIISTTSDWEEGTFDIGTEVVEGSIVIDPTKSSIPLQGLDITTYNSDPETITIFDEHNLIDGDVDTEARFVAAEPGGTFPYPVNCWIRVDLGGEKIIDRLGYYFSNDNFYGDIEYSTNGTDYYLLGELPAVLPGPYSNWYYIDFDSIINLRYIRFNHIFGGPNSLQFNEFSLRKKMTHITAPMQIDGQEGNENKKVIEWTSFEATQTVFPNTSIEYQFRVSDDAETWTDWSEPQSSSSINLTNIENKRYIQIKAILSSTDGVSTPQIDDYTINFHNNLPPNKPTAQTAVIGD